MGLPLTAGNDVSLSPQLDRSAGKWRRGTVAPSVRCMDYVLRDGDGKRFAEGSFDGVLTAALWASNEGGYLTSPIGSFEPIAA